MRERWRFCRFLFRAMRLLSAAPLRDGRYTSQIIPDHKNIQSMKILCEFNLEDSEVFVGFVECNISYQIYFFFFVFVFWCDLKFFKQLILIK